MHSRNDEAMYRTMRTVLVASALKQVGSEYFSARTYGISLATV
jgi:hypothetical protein